MLQKIWTVESKCRLDEFLRGVLPEVFPQKEVSNSKIRRLIVAGCIFVNGRQCRKPAYILLSKTKVCAELEEDKFFFEKQPEELESFLKTGDFQGLNVTIPYKKDVLPYCDEAEFYDNDNGFVKVAEYRNGEFRTVGMRSPNWILDLQNFIKA